MSLTITIKTIALEAHFTGACVIIRCIIVQHTLGIDRARVHLARIFARIFRVHVIGRIESNQIIALRVLHIHAFRAHAYRRRTMIDDHVRTLRIGDLIRVVDLVRGELLRVANRRYLVLDLTARSNESQTLVCVFLFVVLEYNLSVRIDVRYCAVEVGLDEYLLAFGIKTEELLTNANRIRLTRELVEKGERRSTCEKATYCF